jgi:hypothetical protein
VDGAEHAAPPGLLFAIHPNQADAEEHQRACNNAYKRYRDEQLRKLPLLAVKYGIDPSSPDALLQLLLFLAAKDSPGFRLDRGRRGPPKTWDESKHAELMADIAAVQRSKACSDQNACKILLTSPRYRSRYDSYNPKGSLENRSKSLHNRLLEARKARTIATTFLPGMKDYGIDVLIENFGADPDDVKAAQARLTAHKATAQKISSPPNRPSAAKLKKPSR